MYIRTYVCVCVHPTVGIDRAAEVIIAASKSFSIHKPNEVQPSGKKAHRSRSFGANAGMAAHMHVQHMGQAIICVHVYVYA